MAPSLAQFRPWGPFGGKLVLLRKLWSHSPGEGVELSACPLEHGTWEREGLHAGEWAFRSATEQLNMEWEEEMKTGSVGRQAGSWGDGQGPRLPMGRDQSTTHPWRSHASSFQTPPSPELTSSCLWLQIRCPWCLFLLTSQGLKKLLWP